MQLQIETTNVCQAACVFCTYPTMRRPKGVMDPALFQRIIRDAAQIPLIDHITLTGLGETLLDRHLLSRLRYVREVMPAVTLDLYTNGNKLTRAIVDDLIDAGVTTLYVSLNAVRPEQRRVIMKLDDFERVTEVCQYAVQAGEGKMAVVVKAVAAKDLMEVGDAEVFEAQWGGFADKGGAAFLHLEGNWAGQAWKMRTMPTQPCHRALSQIMVLWDGRVSLCCFDGEGEMILGDLKTQTLREVYNSAAYVAVREAHAEGRRAEIPLCAGCTGI